MIAEKSLREERSVRIVAPLRMPLRSFRELGVPESVIDCVVPQILEHRLMQKTPAQLDRVAVEDLVRRVYGEEE